MESLDGRSLAFRVPRLVDDIIQFSSLSPASMLRINFTVVLSGAGRGPPVGLPSICVNVSLTVSTAPRLPATPSPPSRVLDFRNGSVLVGLSSERRDVGPVVSSRLIVVEYTDVVVASTLSQLVAHGLVDTHDSRANDTEDLLVDHDDALARNLSFYVTGEVGLNATEFLVGRGGHDYSDLVRRSSPVVSVYSNPVVDSSRPVSLYVVRQSSLDGVHRRAVSEYLVLGVGSGGPGPAAVRVMTWSWWILVFFAVLGIVAIFFLPVVIVWWVYRRRGGVRDKPCVDPAAAAARGGVKVYAPRRGVHPSLSPPRPAAGTLALSHLDAVVEDRRRDRQRRGGRVTSARRGAFDSYSDTDGDWSFVEPRPIYDGHASPASPSRRRSHCVAVGQLRSYCEQHLWADGGRALADEFRRLPDDFAGPVTAATRPANAACNRAQHCVPYDHNRVQLTSGRYVNASVVRTIGRRRFVVTQSPTGATLDQFWQLVWERNVDVIVALVAADEADCPAYWPADLNRPAVPGDLSVELTGAGVLAHFAVRELLVERRGEPGRRRRIAHWQYTWWCGTGSDG